MCVYVYFPGDNSQVRRPELGASMRTFARGPVYTGRSKSVIPSNKIEGYGLEGDSAFKKAVAAEFILKGNRTSVGSSNNKGRDSIAESLPRDRKAYCGFAYPRMDVEWSSGERRRGVTLVPLVR